MFLSLIGSVCVWEDWVCVGYVTIGCATITGYIIEGYVIGCITTGSVTFILLKPRKFCGFNYVYNASTSIPYHRLTFAKEGMIAEWFGAHSED